MFSLKNSKQPDFDKITHLQSMVFSQKSAVFDLIKTQNLSR